MAIRFSEKILRLLARHKFKKCVGSRNRKQDERDFNKVRFFRKMDYQVKWEVSSNYVTLFLFSGTSNMLCILIDRN